MTDDLNNFLDVLMEGKGMVDLPEGIREKARADLMMRLEQWLLISFMKALPDSESENIEKFAETSPNTEQMMAYFKTNIPNWEEVYKQSLASFQEAYLA